MDLDREIREIKGIAAMYSKRGRLSLAIEILQTALDLQRGQDKQSLGVAETAYQIGELMCDNNNFDEAQPYFELAVDVWQKHHPEDTLGMMWYAQALMRLQDEAGAVANISQDDEDESERESAA